MSTAARPAPALDFEALKARQRATWGSGDYARIGISLQIVGETLCEALDLRAGERVIDVAAGTGNCSLAAARRHAEVTSTDYVESLLEGGRRRAEADGLAVEFRTADAEALPFPDASFDVAMSSFGVMFAPDQERAAAELRRVVRPGGRIGLASWTSEGFLGDLFRVLAAFRPPPAGLRSPMEWGSEARLVQLFGPDATDIATTRKSFAFRFRSAAHWIETFRAFYGPIHQVFAALDAEGRRALDAALTELLERHDVSGGGSLVVPSEYLEAIVRR